MGRLRKGISYVAASVLVAVAVAAGLAYVVYWAKGQTSSLPQRLDQPCPVVVQAVRNGSTWLLSAVFNGDMDGSERVYVVTESGEVIAVSPRPRGTAYWTTLSSAPTHWVCRGAVHRVVS